MDIMLPDALGAEDDLTSPLEVWKRLSPEIRTQVVKLLAQAAYEVITSDPEDSIEVNDERTANHNP